MNLIYTLLVSLSSDYISQKILIMIRYINIAIIIIMMIFSILTSFDASSAINQLNPNSETKKIESPSVKEKTFFNETIPSTTPLFVYAFAAVLGVVGIFSMFNTVMIFKKKEQIDKEMNERLSKMRDELHKIDIIQFDVTSKHKLLESELNRISLESKDKLYQLYHELENKLILKMSKSEEQFLHVIKEIEIAQKNIIDNIEKAEIDFQSFENDIEIFNKHIYSYKLSLLSG